MPDNVLGLPQAEVSPGVFWLDDLNVNYVQLQQEALLLNAMESSMEEGPPSPPGAGGEESPPAGDSGDALGGRLFLGSCTGHLLSPVYQVTNLVLSITGATGGDQYDLFTTPNLSVTNWIWLGRWTNAAASWTINNPPTNESYYAVACVDDADGEGLRDVYEAFVAHTDPNDPDTDYDGRNDYEELIEGTQPLNNTSFTPTRLGYFRFNDASFMGERGQFPLATNALQSVDAWITKGVQLTNSAAQLKYKTVESDGKANINLRNGSVRFWFKPLWNSGVGTGTTAKLIEVGTRGAGTTNGWWSVFANPTGDTVYFVSQTNNAVEVTNLTTSVSFTSNRWSQLVLTYTNGAVALYTNGVLCATNSASVPYPPLSTRTNGFAVGCSTDSDGVAKGLFEDLETFNYPLNANDILENFQLTQPPMLIPNLRLWLRADIGVTTNSAGQIHPWLDQSGSNNDASQLTINNRPLIVPNAIGGKASVGFYTTNYLGLPATLFNGATEAEGFAVLKVTTNTPTSNRGLWQLSGVGGRYPNQDGTISDSLASSGATTTPKPAISISEPHILNSAGKTNLWFSRLNGVTHFTRNENTVRFETFAPFLGNGAGTYFDGQIAEVLLFTRVLNDYERFAIESYLSQRYLLVTNSPSAPGDLRVFAVATNQVSLSWSNAVSNTNLSFLVQRRIPGGSFSNLALVANTHSFMDSDAASGTQYTYRIKAINYSGETALSPETNVTTLSSGAQIPLTALKLWLRADSGHGAAAVNCWLDQTTNNNSVRFDTSKAAGAPTWTGFNSNGYPVINFFGTNAFWVPPLLASATQGEAMVVLRSFGDTLTNWASLWWMTAESLDSRYPYANNFIWDNFGRKIASAQFDSGLSTLATMHLYNPMAKSNQWSAAFNNGSRYTESTSGNPSFPPTSGLLGRGASTVSEFMHGELAELMIFDHELTTLERHVIATNYLNRRFNLW